MTKDGILRHAPFQEVRNDKNSKKVKLEKPELIKTTVPVKETLKISKVSNVKFTHLDKILYPEQDITKQDIVNYYKEIAQSILPYIINRPLTIVRCTSSDKSKCFYQKHIHEKLTKNLYSVTIEGKSGKNEYLYIKDINGLMSLIQLDTLEIHPWACKIDKIERPDYIVFDLDPAPGVPWRKVINAAQFVRENLLSINLKSFIRTSGGKGLHVAVPIARRYEWDDVKNFAKAFADMLAKMKPNDFTSIMSKEKRKNKIFIDYLRNGRGATAIACYSTRARKGALIAMPLSWDEIEKINSKNFTIKTVPKILHERIDPWQDFFKLRQTLSL